MEVSIFCFRTTFFFLQLINHVLTLILIYLIHVMTYIQQTLLYESKFVKILRFIKVVKIYTNTYLILCFFELFKCKPPNIRPPRCGSMFRKLGLLEQFRLNSSHLFRPWAISKLLRKLPLVR